MERSSATDQLVGIRQDLVRSSRLALSAVLGVAMHLRHDGVDVVARNIVDDVDETRRCASMDFLGTKKWHAAAVGRRVHHGVVAHDGDTVSCLNGRRNEERAPKRRRPRPLDERRLGRLVLCLFGIPRIDAAAAHVAAVGGSSPSRRDPDSPLATEPPSPAGLPAPAAPPPAAQAASAIWTLPPPPAILAVSLPSALFVEG